MKMTTFDMDGNEIKNEHIETAKKFWSVPVTINSVVWEEGYHIYEADSAEEALEKYHSEKEVPHDIEYCGWIDQEYRYDELTYTDEEIDEIEEMDSNTEQIQYILRQEILRDEAIAKYNKETSDG
jgi:hypothetical protein